MNLLRRLVIAVVLLYSENTLFAQEVVVVPPFIEDDFGPRCEGEILELGFYDGIDCFKRKLGVCSSPFTNEYEDRSSDIQVSGPGSPELYRQRYYFAGVDSVIINVMMVRVKLTKTGEIRVTSRSVTEFVKGNTCSPDEYRNYILERTWIYKITVVPKPPMPLLNLERYINPVSEGVKFVASGCPTDSKEYQYFYQWNNTHCLSETNEYFFANTFNNDTQLGSGNDYYRVKCATLNGTCTSEPTKFEFGLTYNPPDVSKIPQEYTEQIKKIENQKNSPARIDYHHYPVETIICDQKNDANCTVQNVFNVMLLSNQFIAPITQDMPGFGSNNNRFSYDNILPVKSYEVINLSGPFIRFALESGAEFVANSFPNPVMTYIDYPTHSVINYTLPDHVLSPGRVIRQVFQQCDKIWIKTIGEGFTKFGDINTQDCPQCPIYAGVTADINTVEGEKLFKKVDDRVRLEYYKQFP